MCYLRLGNENKTMVLIVNKKRMAAKTLSEMFRYMGIVSLGVTPGEALSEISMLYRAVIVLNPEELPEARDFVRRLKSYASAVPVFAVGDNLSGFEALDAFDGSFKYSCMSVRLVCYIADYCKKNNLPCIGDYRAAGINATCDLDCITYFGKPIRLTKTEAMIIRLLIRLYPCPMLKGKILDYVFRASRLPDPASVRTHISGINRKFRAMCGRNIIVMVQGKGYVILTPEIAEEYKIDVAL